VIRLQSGCLFAAAFQSIECDCRNQIDRALRIISENQSGVLVYSPGQEGRGAGLEAKMIAMGIEHALGCDSVEAYARLGLPIDSRTYDLEIDALRELSVSKTIGLLGKNPAKKAALEKAGFVVQEFTNFEHGPLTNTAKRKQRRMGFF
jgi:GTP cyclohydrolase II